MTRSIVAYMLVGGLILCGSTLGSTGAASSTKAPRRRRLVFKRRPQASNYTGVNLAELKDVVETYMVNVSTSCKDIIQQHFEEPSRAVPLNFPDNISNSYFGATSVPKELKFLHIPKTAGASVELATRRIQQNTTTPIVRTKLHSGRVSAHSVPVPVGDFSNESCKCSSWHIPPRYYMRRHERNPYYGTEVFCVIRDPLDRALSGFRMHSGSNTKLLTSKTAAQAYLANTIRKLRQLRCQGDCHILPQSEYVYSTIGNRTCHDVIRYGPKLKLGFDSLMMRMELPNRLPETPTTSHHQVVDGIVTESSIDPFIAKIVRCAYPLDLCLLGYDAETGSEINGQSPLEDTGCAVTAELLNEINRS